jgi:hypothetical protein
METGVVMSPSTQWPEGDRASCACPHCGNIDVHQIAIVREWGHDSRDGECSACLGEYMVVAKGDQGVTIKAPAGFDARRAAVYMQFQAEEWFGVEKMVTNLGMPLPSCPSTDASTVRQTHAARPSTCTQTARHCAVKPQR